MQFMLLIVMWMDSDGMENYGLIRFQDNDDCVGDSEIFFF